MDPYIYLYLNFILIITPLQFFFHLSFPFGIQVSHIQMTSYFEQLIIICYDAKLMAKSIND